MKFVACVSRPLKLWLMPGCALIFSACVLHWDYPATWAPLLADERQTCADISGKYEEVGAMETMTCTPKSFICRLSDNLLSVKLGRSAPEARGTHVEIKQPDQSSLIVILWNHETLVGGRVFSMAKGDFTCTDEGIVIEGTELTSGLPGGVFSYTRSFKRSKDGFLVKKQRAKGGSWHIPAIIPLVGSATTWTRFKPLLTN